MRFINAFFGVLVITLFLFQSCQHKPAAPLKDLSTGQWRDIVSADKSEPVERHEAAFIRINDKLVLLGGRGIKPVSLFDIKSQKWTLGAKPPVEIHHFQPIVFDEKIYIIGALTGPYPGETPLPNVYIYDPSSDIWTKGDEIPEGRRRGSAGLSVYKDKIYLTCGIKDGHRGDHKQWHDVYDPATGSWKELTDAPRARDHFQSAIMNDKIYVAAGRRTQASTNPLKGTETLVDVYDIASDSWTTIEAQLPTPRAGNAAFVYNNQLLIVGGESSTQLSAHSDVEAYTPSTNAWTTLPSMKQGRHGSGVVQVGDKLIIASGCGNRGGGPELPWMEMFSLNNEILPFNVFKPNTKVGIKDEKVLVNGTPTHQGKSWKGNSIEGLLFNARLVQGIFDDENSETRDRWKYPDTDKWNANRNTEEFIQSMDDWKAHGLDAFTLNLQGGSPMGYGNKNWKNTAFDENGTLKTKYMVRLDKILKKADNLNMVVILGLFYFGQDQFLKDEAAILNAVDNFMDWLSNKGYDNVLIEVNNECDVKRYDHEILTKSRVHELIKRIKAKTWNGKDYLVSTSFGGGRIPTDSVVKYSDFVLIHGNGVKDPKYIKEMVENTKALPSYKPMPIIFNEDDHFDFDKPENNFASAIEANASWGYFDYRMDGESFENGFQSIPADWSISSERKKGFFGLLKEITRK